MSGFDNYSPSAHIPKLKPFTDFQNVGMFPVVESRISSYKSVVGTV